MNNIDTDELQKFETHAHQWWDESGDFRTLHHINPVRMQFILDHVDITNKKILDIGCGGGILAESLAKANAIVTGIDMAEALINVAQLHAQKNNLSIHYEYATAESFADKKANQYDIVTCMELLEHVPDPSSIVQACARLVKPGGHIFFSTINRTFKAYLFAIIGAEYIVKLLPRHTHDYSKFIKPAELAGWARECGLQIDDIVGMKYEPFTHSASLADDVSVNYLMYCSK